MYDICCIGHITRDKIVTPDSEVQMAGGTSFYFSNAICQMDINYMMVTSLADTEFHFVTDLRSKGINVKVLPGRHTVFFENSYGENPDERTQRVFQKADPFTVEQFLTIEAQIFHLGPLLADDMSVELIQALSKKGKLSLDVQGYLREVRNEQVCAVDWFRKTEALPYIDFLKASEHEMKVLTGLSDIRAGAKCLYEWGAKEVIITMGSKGSVIYNRQQFYDIPAFAPRALVDGTGCGDTYMAGYLYKRCKQAGIQEAGEFAAAMATLNIESSGPFTGNENDVLHLLAEDRMRVFSVE